MTRFARAKGSKASNERVPNEATPWHVMKQQLEDNTWSKNGRPEKAKTAKQLLKEKDDLFYCGTTGNVNNDWAEFDRPKAKSSKDQTAKEEIKSEDTRLSIKNKKKLKSTAVEKGNGSFQDSAGCDIKMTPGIKTKKRKTDISFTESVEASVDSIQAEVVDNVEPDSTVSQKKKSKERNSASATAEFAEFVVERSEKVEEANEAESEPKKKKKKKKMRKDKIVESSAAESTEVVELTKEEEEIENGKVERSNEASGKMSKRQKRNQKRKNKVSSNEAIADGVSSGEKADAPTSGGFDAAGNEWSSNVNFGKQQKFEKKLNDTANGDQGRGGKHFEKTMNRAKGPGNTAVKRKAPKIRDDNEHKRRKPDVGSIKCTINGMDLEIVKYDGFPVKKEDAERLKELRQQMILKGIPKSEIDAAMKLERRKAEKALARVRKQVCFHCRKAGHNLSDCPELGEGESATGICFKCGSTEHTHYECKVTKKQEYGFASCFICREQGHIAKQCPDNPKGLYPQGGSCKICGDVTHLRKDCPDLTKEKEENAMTLSTITESTLESLDEDITKTVASDDSKRAKGKVVKF